MSLIFPPSVLTSLSRNGVSPFWSWHSPRLRPCVSLSGLSIPDWARGVKGSKAVDKAHLASGLHRVWGIFSGENAVQKRLILYIDDDPACCELVESILTDAGFEVRSAPDGLSGITLARSAQPAVVLVDMILPGLGGIRTCQQLKQDPALASTVVVAVTSSPDLRYIEQAFRAGAEFFLMKPFAGEMLVQVVESAAQRAQVGGYRRAHPRFPVELPVQCFMGEVGGKAVNASVGGLRVYLTEKLSPGTIFQLQLKLPTETVTAEAKVIWQDDEVSDRSIRHTHGVQILSFVEDSGFLQYKRFLRQIAAGSPA